MKLGSLKEGGRDGTLVVVSRDLSKAVKATGIAPTLQAALDDWSNVAPRLNALSESLNAGHADGAFALDMNALAAPLPRAYEFVDGSAYLPHVARVRKARGAEVPESFYTDPLMYQATSSGFYGPRDPILAMSEEWGIDLEAEIIVITDDVPMGVSAAEAERHIQLVGLVNDVSLRNLIPPELAKGFGFLQSKPRSALSPVFVTPDELGDAWKDSKLHLPMRTWINGEWFGAAEAGVDMQFGFGALVAHAAKTRPLAAGDDRRVGHDCERGCVERRVMSRRAADGGDIAGREGVDAVSEVRRCRADRDHRCGRRESVRDDRAEGDEARGEALSGADTIPSQPSP